MAQSDNIKRYLDAGMAFTQMTRDRAEDIVKDLVKVGEVRRKEAGAAVEDLLEHSRKNTEEVVALVRKEVARQLKAVGLDDLAKRALAGTAKKSTAKKTAAKKSAAKKSTAKKSTAKNTAAKKSTAKKSTAKKTAAKKSTAKKSTAKKSAAKKSTAKKA
ncbi:MAG: histone H1-like repetitive region-containing protein [Acidimicrobiales bacterium]